MMETDPLLQDIDCVIVDEVHERSLETDFLLLVLRDVMRIRNAAAMTQER
eukprot:GSA25T00021636001.1